MKTQETLKTSVCILGCGPAGIVLGNILLHHGIDCLIIDKYNREEIYARGRAGAIESTTLALLKKHSLADTILQNGRCLNSCEFRHLERCFTLDYGKLSGGDAHYFYPQSNLNDDLIKKYLDKGGKLLFNCEGKSISYSENHITVHSYDKRTNAVIEIQADFVAGCDGYHGLARQSIPEGSVNIYKKQYPYSWLAILAYAPPSSEHSIYGLHPDGFAAHLFRNRKVTRYYLQIDPNDNIDNWPDERVWATLQKRLAKQEWSLTKGEIFDKRILSLRSYVMEPMRYQRLLMAGDAAHIIAPMGGKGLNLAVQDAGVLAETLIHFYLEQQELSFLDGYSEIRLPYIWRAQEFSYSLLNMTHLPESGELDNRRFLQKLSESKLAQLQTSDTYSKDFSRNYVGIV